MELKIKEINNSSEELIYEDNAKKVTVNPTTTSSNLKTTSILKPKISYDDILTSLNMKVNNGKLEFISKPTTRPNTNTVTNATIFPPPLKQRNNYIYNKYFGDYKEIKHEIPRRPLTRTEYIKKLKDDKRERYRVYQIKPNKLFFPHIRQNFEPYYENNDMVTNKLFSLR